MSLFAALPLWLPQIVTAPSAQAPAPASGEVAVWHWLAFGALVLGLLVLDLSVFHRQASAPTFRESALWTVVWCSLALAFDLLLWWWRGGTVAVYFMTGYLLEWSLSMDNVFVFAVLFNTYFLVPLKYQYRVLFWGILGAIVMRLTFVLAGAAALKYADWILPLFGIVLSWQALKLGLQGSHDIDPERTSVMRLARRWLPDTPVSGSAGHRMD
jgi:tellurite resistance protein TerC